MNFPLKNFEQYLPEMALVLGEQLFEQGFVGRLRQMERHLWVANVVDKEVEIQISPTKVKAYTCDCGVFQQQKICEHIGAMLLALRQTIDLKNQAKLPKVPKKKAPLKLTVDTILNNAPPAQVYAFLKAYAKADRNFALALKSRFAGVVPMENTYEKYRQLLEATIKGNRLANGQISYRGWQQAAKLGQELLRQTDDAFALENYQEGTMILRAIIEKITPIIGKSKGDEQVLRDIAIAAFHKLEALLKMPIAPDLRERLWNFCLQESTRDMYRQNGMTEYFYRLMQYISDDNEKVETLLESVDNELVKENLTELFRANLLMLKFNLLNKSRAKSAIEHFVTEHTENPDFLVFVIAKMMEQKEISRAKLLTKKGLKQKFSKNIRVQLTNFLLQIAIDEQNQPALQKHAIQLFLDTKDFQYYQILKENRQENWASLYEKIMAEIAQMPSSIQKRNVMAKLLHEEKRWTELLTLIEHNKSLDLLQRYAQTLLKSSKKETKELYQKFLSAYLTNHIGRKPAEKTREILSHLFQIGERKLAQQLARQLKKDFAHRDALVDELSAF